MNTLHLEYEWMKKTMPEGFPYPSSTLISGEGGTGKPLVVYAFVASWLKAGGSAISLSLQYSTNDFMRTSMNRIYGINLDDYAKNMVYIQLTPSIDGYEITGENTINANLIKPDVWNASIDKAVKLTGKSEIGVLVFGAALNLLLFSPTYKEGIIKNLEDILKNDKRRTYILSVSTSAFADDIKIWENVADNLMFTRMEKPMKLFFKITKMEEVEFSKDEIEVPVSQKALKEIKEIAESSRNKILPEIMNV